MLPGPSLCTAYNASRVFLWRPKDPFNCLFTFLIKRLVLRCISSILRQFFVVLLDMPLYRFDTALGMSASLSGRAVGAYRGGSCIPDIRHGLSCGILTAGIRNISRSRRTHRKHTSATRVRLSWSADACRPWTALCRLRIPSWRFTI